ncbi:MULTISPECIES: hypothetical protein [Paenibacillus]|uniref:hypothetical protein n=1 Tax=Paenibacillus TaxID=44249 RepID=UPI00142E289D|nr:MULTISPECIES: hypothetical protein [Paenibacillus]
MKAVVDQVSTIKAIFAMVVLVQESHTLNKYSSDASNNWRNTVTSRATTVPPGSLPRR